MIANLLFILLGVVLLVVNVRLWKKQNKTFDTVKSVRETQNIISQKLTSFWREWMQYFRGYNNEKMVLNASVMFVTFGMMLFVNIYWTHFNWGLIIALTILILIWGMMHFGRATNKKLFDNSFPEVLSVVNAAVSSGSSIHHALERCGQDVAGPLGAEFHLISRRLNLGEDAEVVFDDAYQRFKYKEFYFFIIVMLVSVQRGGQLRVLMNRLSRVVASTKAMERKKLAMTSEARMSAKIVAAIPLLFFIGMKFLNPENFDFIINDSTGQLILYYVLASEGIGLSVIWFLVKRAT
ncbi:type II secretion system F family protein [Pragia fontium]|uniref:Tight adherence protein B n=2 Tax=Pragia fontium TaxID=82985 RepID=A0AAJ4W8A1_9GAMM|nr:type II secretion system F family protein [Pragia fontium]GKX63309.1 tight adherance operon protein [Pragia fontium]SFC13589.1 tight adherence protein B [Pragia fontium DSM 5563 = ATCC 49100]SUB81324.1 Flp pilus assembly protein TadB [Pragia fontium]VEJ53502.1 Flp pilus assembly protein TadB [Pragia fontium]